MNAQKHIYVIILILKLVQNSQIIVEFNSTLSEIPNDLSPIDFVTSLISNELYVNLNIGNPFQNLDFLLDFDSYHTYIIKDNLFQESTSTTFKNKGKAEYFQNLNFQKASVCSDFLIIKDNIKNINYSFL